MFFFKFVQHFVHHAELSSERPCLLLLDNYASQLLDEGLDFLQTQWRNILSFPFHCSRTLQSCDKSIYGPFKKFINTACDLWTTSNRLMTIYDIPDACFNSSAIGMQSCKYQSRFQNIKDTPS